MDLIIKKLDFYQLGIGIAALLIAAIGSVVAFQYSDATEEFLEVWQGQEQKWLDAAEDFFSDDSAENTIDGIAHTRGLQQSAFKPQVVFFEEDEIVYHHSPYWLPEDSGWEGRRNLVFNQRENLRAVEWYLQHQEGDQRRKAFVFLPLTSDDPGVRTSIFQSNFPGFVPFEATLSESEVGYHLEASEPIRRSGYQMVSAIVVLLAFFSMLTFVVLILTSRFRKHLLNPVRFVYILIPVLVGRLLLQTVWVSDVLRFFPLFDTNLLSWGGQWSLGLLLIDVLLYFALAVTFLNFPVLRRGRQLAPGIRAGLTVGGYLVIISGWIFFSRVVGSIVLDSSINMDLDNVFGLDRFSFLTLAGILVFLVAQFFVSIKIGEVIHNLGIPLSNRVMSIAAAALMSLPLMLIAGLAVHPFPFYIAVFLFLFLLDLFSEKARVGYPWLLMWMLVLPSCAAALMYKYSLDKELRNRVEVASYFSIDRFDGSPDSDTFYQILREVRKDGEANFDYAVYRDSVRIWSNNPIYPNVLAGEYAQMDFDRLSRIDRRTELLLSLDDQEKYNLLTGRYSADLSRPISLFSYMFFLLCIFVVVLGLLNKKPGILPERWSVQITTKPSLRSKVQILIISLTVTSFILVGFITIYFFQVNNQRDLQTALLESAQKVQSLGGHLNPDGDLSTLSRETASDLKVEMGIYDSRGLLVASAPEPNLANSGLPGILNPDWMVQGESGKSVFLEGVHLDFPQQKMLLQSWMLSDPNYFFLIGPDPVFRQHPTTISDFLSPLLNVYLFLFILSGALAFVFTDGITKPLSRIRDSLNKVKLGKENEPIEWKKNDELGELIDDYNRIIREIDESAKLLAMTEREVAWREMAKQIAHEIKNPLTPMKLSIQHLQFASRKNPEKLQELIGRTSSTLIEQIDNLSRIASEFSTFAKMPEAKNEKVNLNELVSSAHDLFRNRDDMDIELIVPIDEIYVFADRNYMLRVLTNLMKNSIQAIPIDRRGRIRIKLYQKSDLATIEVRDNGCGIPEDVRQKVFKPNFTSKNSGTGLGLAICNNIVESFHGRIFFETEVEEGTSFFVELPKMRSEEDIRPTKRVQLD